MAEALVVQKRRDREVYDQIFTLTTVNKLRTLVSVTASRKSVDALARFVLSAALTTVLL